MGIKDDPRSSGIRILIVEDSPTQREQLRFLLEEAGYQVVATANGEEALKEVEGQMVDLVISDIVMPGLDGYEFCKRLRATPRFEHLPVILLTSLADPRDVIRGLESGANNFICKPYEERALLARIQNILTNQEIRRASNSEMGISIFFAGQRFFITADRLQILDLLLSTYENAVSRNTELNRTRDELRALNEQLEARVAERTAALTAEIAERKAAEREREKSESCYRELFEKMGSGVAIYEIHDQGSKLVLKDINRAGERISQVQHQEVIGRNADEVFPGMRAAGLFDLILRVWRTGVPEAFPPCLYKDERLSQWVKNYVYQLPTGEVVTIYEDITEQKQAEEEREKLQTQLLQAQKMESVGRLAGGVAHDFNNMLGVILGHVELLLNQVAPDNPLRESLSEIYNASLRSSDLTRQLLAFARKQTISPQVIDLNQTLEGTRKMLKRLIGEDIDLAWRPKTGLWTISMDPSQVDQILANLCVNARDAISGVGKITIETDNVVLDATFGAAQPGFVPGEYVLLSVSDTGCGMNKETLSHLFEPFFTTKVNGKGTGLGLATVFGIVKQNHGHINVYSEPSHGSTFKVYLPRSKAAFVTPAPSEKQRNLRGNETVLVVEDEPGLLTLTKTILERYGYQVLTAETPAKAIALVESFSGPLQLLITDVVMPKMNGRELHARITALKPMSQCLFVSGYTENAIAHHGMLDKGVYFLPKPFSVQALAEKVRIILDDGQPPVNPPIKS